MILCCKNGKIAHVIHKIASMNSPLIDTSDHNPCFTTSQDVAELSAPLTKLGIDYFSFTRVDKNGGRTYLHNQAHILQFYIRQQYYLQGNTEGLPQTYKRQIVLWETLANQTIFNEAARPFNVDHGIYIIEPHKEYCDFFGFAPINGSKRIINTYFAELDYLKKFAHEFKGKADTIIRRVNEKKLVLPFNKKLVDFTQITPQDTNVATTGSTYQQVKITARQYDIAQRMIQGMNGKAIAKELKISPRTVETHYNHMKEKLNCKNRIELILELVKII